MGYKPSFGEHIERERTSLIRFDIERTEACGAALRGPHSFDEGPWGLIAQWAL